MTAAGYLRGTAIQEKCMSRIIGGQDLIAIGPEGSGKTTTYILGILMRLKYGLAEAPRALILVPSNEQVQYVLEQFALLNKNDSFSIVGLSTEDSMEGQVNELTDGVDIVIAVPSRARAVYLKLGLNTNKIQMMVIDDAEEMIRKGFQLPITELANSIQKCQHLVFTEVIHDKLNRLVEPFIRFPAIIEVEEIIQEKLNLIPQWLYQVPNFRTKLNLLNLLLADEEVFHKVVVFVNTRLTAQTLARDLFDGKGKGISVCKPLFFDEAGYDTMADFKADPEGRVLVVANELRLEEEPNDIPFIIHFDMPEDQKIYLDRMRTDGKDEEVLAITFATDLELPLIRKIEGASGIKMERPEIPDGLLVEEKTKGASPDLQTDREEENILDKAFHLKKSSNAKTTNYGMGEKLKMNKRKKYN